MSLPKLIEMSRVDFLTIDTIPALSTVPLDGDTIRFELPPLGPGTHQLALAADAIRDLQGTPLEPYSASLLVEPPPPRLDAPLGDVSQTRESAARIALYPRTARQLHDTALRREAADLDARHSDLGKWAWLCEFEQTRRNRHVHQDRLHRDAVDILVAQAKYTHPETGQ